MTVPLVILGASTGGTRVLPIIFEHLPPVRACFVLVQHLTAFMAPFFARTLGQSAQMEVCVAAEQEKLEAGRVLIVPGDRHGVIVQHQRLVLQDGPKVNFVRPAVDVTMLSLDPPAGARLMGVILTGMGKDGAAGIQHMKQLGAITIAQDQASCAVFGMPARAIATGCVDHVLPPVQIAGLLAKLLR